MRLFRFLCLTILITCLGYTNSIVHSTSIDTETQSIIIEVEGDPNKHMTYFQIYHPYVDVVATYDVLFNGLALKVPTSKMLNFSSIDFVKAIHPVQTYETSSGFLSETNDPSLSIPSDFNPTNYTGKGVKIAVIDTGVDYNHSDLADNFRGGYDLVDLDDDPMETLETEGIPTIHGTHVAGIIAANGKIKGVAPDSEIYAYRALGPGGQGSTVQVIAAMEQAIKDEVDIMNLSLGNTVNGPDYPTSMAVNQAIDLGVVVVIANGNNGPENWTVGSPATASKAVSVGATSKASKEPILYDARENKEISINVMNGSIPWTFQKDFQIVTEQSKNKRGKIVLFKRDSTPFNEKAKQAEEAGAIAVLIYNNEEGNLHGSIGNLDSPFNIPVAGIDKKSGEWLSERADSRSLYLNTLYFETKENVAPFSSRGPVTINWQIKPDVLAPGTNVLSTIPGDSYQALQGTSMAAPHVAGAIAIIKEAKPNWSNEQIIGALKTTALQMEEADGKPLEPIEQGAGEVQIDEAIHTKTIITNSLLTFEKVDEYKETRIVELHIENMSDEVQTYFFDMPKKQTGLSWKLPKSFTVNKNEVKKIPIELNVTTQQLEKAIHQGWLTLNQANEKHHLPYLFINKKAELPGVSGFQFSLKTFSQDLYSYRIHIAEEIKGIDIHLYHPDTLVYEGKLMTLNNLELGVNEGQINKNKVKHRGFYKAMLSIELETGEFDAYETDVFIE